MIVLEKLKRKARRGFDLAEVLVSSGGFEAFVKWKPFSVSSFRMCQRLKDLGIPFKTIVDGGANVGQFSRAAVETFVQSRVFSFEPLPDISKLLKNNLSDNSRVKIFEAALGRENGKENIYRNLHVHSSSMLPLHAEHNEVFPDTQNRSVERLPVRVLKLDSALKNHDIKSPILLKLDVQGFELEALRGAARILRRVTAILLEVTFAPLYEKESSFHQIEDFLKRHGFRFERPIDFLKDGKGRIAQMDALFLRH